MFSHADCIICCLSQIDKRAGRRTVWAGELGESSWRRSHMLFDPQGITILRDFLCGSQLNYVIDLMAGHYKRWPGREQSLGAKKPVGVGLFFCHSVPGPTRITI